MKNIPPFLKDLMKFAVACGLLLGVLSPVLAYGQVNTNFWKISSGLLSPIISTFTLQVSSQGSDPSGSNGAIYYNTGSNTFRCYQNGSWTGCIGAGGGSTAAGTWSTTTSQVANHLNNYPNNSTDVVVVGSSATTTSNYYIDPSVIFAFFKYASSTAFTATNFFATTQTVTGNSTLTDATTTSLAIANIANGLLKVNSSGSILLATAGTDYDTFSYPFTNVNTFGTSTAATGTSILTQGVFYASSTVASSKFPYASTTALTATTLYSTDENITNNSSLVNATSTNFSTTVASTSVLYGAQLSTCSLGLMLRWATGSFGCTGIPGGGTTAWATTTSQFPSILTVSPLNRTDVVTIGSNSTTTATFYVDPNKATLFFGTTTAGNSTLTVGTTGNEWSLGENSSGNLFQISSSTTLGVNNAISIDKNLVVTLGNASTTQLSSSALYASNLTSGNCLQASTGGQIIDTGSACGSGGGGSQTPWTANESAAGFTLNNLNVLNTNTFNATSTTGSSTVQNALSIGSTAGDHMLYINPSRSYGTSPSVGGAFLLNNTSNNGIAAEIYSNNPSLSSSAPLLSIEQDNATPQNVALSIIQRGNFGAGEQINCTNTTNCEGLDIIVAGTSGSSYNLKLEGYSPQIEWNDTNLTAPNGQWEMAVDPFSDFFYISARDAANTTYLNNENFSVYPTRKGGRMSTGSSTPYASFSVQATSTIYNIVGSSSPVMVVAGTSSKPYFIVGYLGNVGADGTTSPGTTLALGSGSNYINVQDSATSTFSHGINLTGGCISVNGSCAAIGSTAVTNVASGDGTLSISPNVGNVVAGLNLGHANTWLTIQTFGAASTTQISASYASSTVAVFGNATLNNVTGVSGNCLQADINGKITGSGGACGTGTVNNVTNSDGSLTISPTTGNVVGSLNTGHANAFTALQTFTNATSTLFTSTTAWITNLFVPTGLAIATTSVGSSALAIQGNQFIAGNITSTSTAASVFPYASSTAVSATSLYGGNVLIAGNTVTNPSTSLILGGSAVRSVAIQSNGSNVAYLDTSKVVSANTDVYFPDWGGTFAIATGTLQAPAFVGTSTATSTLAGGLNVASGCFSVANTCLQTLVSAASAYKQAVKYASTSTLPANTYNNGTGGVGATITGTALAPLFIDGNTAALGDRILVKDEATGANNGIYTVTTAGISSVAAFVLTRATDYNSSADVFPGVANFTNSGTTNANTCWILTNTSAVTIGTTALTYDDACGAGSFTATSPIVLTGTVISFAAPASSALSIPYASSTGISALYASSTSLYGGTIFAGGGLSSNPAYSFTNDTDTGLYNGSANTVTFSAGGTASMRVDGTGIYGQGANDAYMRNQQNSITNPAFTFSGDSDTGMYSSTANSVEFTTGGTRQLLLNTSGATLTYASTTALTASNSAYFATSAGSVGVGTTSPWGLVSIASTGYTYAAPLFNISTSTGVYGNIFNVSATSSVMGLISTAVEAVESGVRIGIGTISQYGFGGLLDQFVVKGRINTEGWNNANCDIIASAGASSAQFLGGCPGFLGSSSNFSSEFLNQPAAGGFAYAAVNLPAATAVNTGVGYVMAEQQFGSSWMIPATTTPVMEINARIEFPQNSTSTLYYIGFDDNSKSGSFVVVTPSNGCYFTASSTKADWIAVASNSATQTLVDTNIASSTNVTARGGFLKFRIEASNGLCSFYIQNGETNNLTKVASITTNVPSTHAVAPNIWITNNGASATGLQNSLDFNHFRVWWRDFLPPGGV